MFAIEWRRISMTLMLASQLTATHHGRACEVASPLRLSASFLSAT